MCTVSYIGREDLKYFTSNRDENKSRPVAGMPETETRNGKKITFPKDPVAGGTWFAVSGNGTVGVLLNGAFQKHIPAYPYQKSRGLILLELMDAPEGIRYFDKTLPEKIEPFTIIFFQNEILYELRWDGHQKYRQQLDTDGNYIWSSVTLYSKDVIHKRNQLFRNFIADSTLITGKSIREFHVNNHNDYENGFVIRRPNGIQTQSITQAVIEEDHIRFFYYDMLFNRTEEQIIQVQKQETIEKG